MRLMSRSRAARDWLPALTAAIPVVIIYLAVLGIVLTAAGPEGLNLGAGETSGWIALLSGWPPVLALVLTIRYRQPLLLTGNVFAVIFLSRWVIGSASRRSPPPRWWPGRSCSSRLCSGSRVGSQRGSPIRSCRA
jgi:predicted benzoate:H+ symporter BenE